MINNNETKLKKLLRKKRITQTELYYLIKERCNSYLGHDVISRIVNGKKTNYHIDTLLKLCIALNCAPNDIIDKQIFIKKQVKDTYRKRP